MNRPCLYQGCPEVSPSTYCPAHRATVEKARHNSQYDTPHWRRLRARTLAKHRKQWGELCPGYRREPHLAPLLSVDHIVPVEFGGAMYDEGNVQVLCVSCNSRKGVGAPS